VILFYAASRVCPGRTTQYPITTHNPVFWIHKDNPRMTVVHIDGFIVTKESKINGIFKKFEYIKESTDQFGEIQTEVLLKVFPKDEIRLIKQLADSLNCQFRTFIWPKNFPEGYEVNEKLIYSLSLDIINDNLAIQKQTLISIKELEAGIRSLRGQSFTYGKPLNSAASNVECYLANKTNNPWPGDIDAIIYDKAKQKFVAFIEFKTHNKNTPIVNEHIGKYGQQDWRRFDVLFNWIDNFSIKFGYKPKLFFIVWGTNQNYQNHANLKIDIIERNKLVKSMLYPRPPFDKFSESLVAFLLNAAII